MPHAKELLQIEFRYKDKPPMEGMSEHCSKTIALGIFDTFEDAAIAGNKALEAFEARYKVNKGWGKSRFSKNGAPFGRELRLISPLGYLVGVPFDFYAKIEKLTFDDVEDTISEVLSAIERFKKYDQENQ